MEEAKTMRFISLAKSPVKTSYLWMMRIYDVSEEVCWQLTVFTDDMVEWMDMEVCKQEAKHAMSLNMWWEYQGPGLFIDCEYKICFSRGTQTRIYILN